MLVLIVTFWSGIDTYATTVKMQQDQKVKGIVVDENNGYDKENGIQKGLPHPYRSYSKMGIPLAAFIQYYR